MAHGQPFGQTAVADGMPGQTVKSFDLVSMEERAIGA
jgi:hypothetical protein